MRERSNHVLFSLLHKHANKNVFDDFLKISDYVLKFFEDFSKLFEGQTNVSQHFPKITENWRRLPN